MNAMLLGILLASLAGSLHCAGMCGPFAAFYATGVRGASLAPQAAYHAARLATYAALGALAGLLGGAIDLAGRGLGARHVATTLAGLLLVTAGALALARHVGARVPKLPFLGLVAARLGPLLARLREQPPVTRAAAVGLATTLLPCGWLHSFLIAAAGTASAGSGAALMAAFWLGTVPLLAMTGAIFNGVGGTRDEVQRGGTRAFSSRESLRRHGPALSAAAVIALGLVALAHGAPALGGMLAGKTEPASCHGGAP